MPIDVKVVLRRPNPQSCRLKAFLVVNGREVASWWIEDSTCTRRYNPFKPVPPKAWIILEKLPNEKMNELALFLLTAKEGDEFTATI